MGIGSHMGHEAAKEMRLGICGASSNLASGMEEVAKSGEKISENMLVGWLKSLRNLQRISKDFNSTVHTTVTKTLLSVEKAIELGDKVTKSMLMGWMESLKEVNHLINTLPYVGQHTGEFFALRAIEVISRGIHSLLKHPLAIFIIITIGLLLVFVNFRLLVVLIRDPIFQALAFALVSVLAAYLWNKQNKLAEQQSNSSSTEYKQQLQTPINGPDHLTACQWGSNCRDIEDAKHREKYSHPSAPYKPDDKRILCQWGSNCRDIADAKHCEKYSHPSTSHKSDDKRIPCRWGSNCRDLADAKHREKYSHTSAPHKSDDKRILCKWGSKCHDIDDAKHREKYSHPSASHQSDDKRILCKWGLNCRDISDAKHREKYSHHSSK